MTDIRQQFLKFIKIYGMDDSLESTRTLYRVIKNSFDSIDSATMHKALNMFTGTRTGEILEYANNIGDVDFIDTFYKYRTAPVKVKFHTSHNGTSKVEKYNGYSNKDIVVEQFDAEDLSFMK